MQSLVPRSPQLSIWEATYNGIHKGQITEHTFSNELQVFFVTDNSLSHHGFMGNPGFNMSYEASSSKYITLRNLSFINTNLIVKLGYVWVNSIFVSLAQHIGSE